MENRQFSNSNLRESIESTEYIINNRGKIYYDNNPLYIQAERGYENENNEFILENVIFNGHIGNGKAGQLLINNEMNIFTFTKNPEIIIYLNR